jgi:5S rRNA maturation endonuclease (ribonuclease M5)
MVPRPPLRSVRIHDVRSVWGPPLDVPLGPVTVLVGPNRSGTSNVAWAVAAALDPDRRFRPHRDRPRRRDEARPSVTLDHADGSRRVVRWDPHQGTRTDSGAGPVGHVVLSRVDETPRDLLRRLPLDLDTPQEREALAGTVREVAREVLPEVADAAIDRRLAVRLRDELGSVVPVPETRAIVALACARHLAVRGAPPVAVVVDNPDAFLHPAAQETLAGLLVEVALATHAAIVVTTASPFAIPRVSDVEVVSLARDAAGRTGVVATASGDATQARLLGGLLRDPGLAEVLDRVGRIPPGTRAVLVVEGGTDQAYLELVAATMGRADVLDDVEIRPSGGAMGAALAAIVLRAELEVPVLVLLDHDAAGRRARDTLVSRFGFDRGTQVLTYADVIEGGPPGIEAETLFPTELLRRFVAETGPSAAHRERREHGVDHVDLTGSGKSAFVGWLEQHLRADQLGDWSALLELLDERLGLTVGR